MAQVDRKLVQWDTGEKQFDQRKCRERLCMSVSERVQSLKSLRSYSRVLQATHEASSFPSSTPKKNVSVILTFPSNADKTNSGGMVLAHPSLRVEEETVALSLSVVKVDPPSPIRNPV